MNPPDAAPLIQLFRSNSILKLYRDDAGADPQTPGCGTEPHYTLQVARLRKAPVTLENLSAEQALTALAAEMDGGRHG